MCISAEDDEEQSILHFDSRRLFSKVRLCISYRLLVWSVLSLGSTLSFMARSSQAAVFMCRRLGLAERAGAHNVTSADVFQTGSEVRTSRTSLLNDGSHAKISLVGAGINMTAVEEAYHLWSKEVEDWVISSVSIGYYLVQIPASILAVKLGAERVCVTSALVCLVTSYLSVPAVSWGPWQCAAVCFFKGASAGALYPAVTSVASKWCGRTETSMLTCFVESGIQVGNAASFLAVALLCKGGEGWENVFYLQAGLGILFGVMFWLTVDKDPSSRSRCLAIMPNKEREFLTQSMDAKGFSTEKTSIPFKAIFKSFPVWAIVVAELSTEWLDCLMATTMPGFLGTGLGIDEKFAEWITFAFFLLPIPLSVVSASIVEWLLQRNAVSLTNMRKVCNILGQGVPAVCYLLLPFLPKNGEHTVAMVTALYVVSGSVYGLTDCAWLSNVYDIAPRYTGFLFSLGEMLTAWSWSVCTVLVGYMAPQDTKEQWHPVMYMSAGLIFACIIFYTIFASADQQPWAGPPESDDNSSSSMSSSSRRNSIVRNGKHDSMSSRSPSIMSSRSPSSMSSRRNRTSGDNIQGPPVVETHIE